MKKLGTSFSVGDEAEYIRPVVIQSIEGNMAFVKTVEEGIIIYLPLSRLMPMEQDEPKPIVGAEYIKSDEPEPIVGADGST